MMSIIQKVFYGFMGSYSKQANKHITRFFKAGDPL
jgi:hypothetical protein